MQIYLGVGDDFSEDRLRFTAQVGADGLNGAPTPTDRDDGYFHVDTLRDLKAKVESFGLKMYSVRMAPWHWTFKWMLGLPGRDEQIENYQKLIRNMGEAGIPILTYNMHTMRYYRTGRDAPARGGSTATRFDFKVVENAPLMAAGGADISLIPEEYRKPVTDDELWANLEYFLKAVIPVAEQSGVRLALHPDDPPIPQIGQVARIMRSPEAFRRATEIVDSDSNGIHFCQGCFTEMGVDLVKEITYFGSRNKIVAVDFRNIIGHVNDFREAWPDEGQADMAATMKAYKDVGFEGPLCPDHIIRMDGDSAWGHRYWAYAVGHMRGLEAGIDLKR
jgi:mannonate dehydratase